MAQTHRVIVHRDVSYLSQGEYDEDKDKVDLYLPLGVDRFPVLFVLHGGGLVMGDKLQQCHIGDYFARQGFGVVCTNYRLSPGVSHPAHIQDAALAFAWVHENIASYGGDPERILVAGHSAGAYLAALLVTDSRYLRAHGLGPANVLGVVPVSGFFHVERVAPDRSKAIWGESRESWLEASPVRYIAKQLPPMLFLYADGDAPERRQESRDMVEALRAQGNETSRALEIPDRNHLTIWSRIGSENDETSKRMLTFMREILSVHGTH